MACGSGCCAPRETPQIGPSPAVQQANVVNTGILVKADAEAVDESCCATGNSSGAPEEKMVDTCLEDGCCAGDEAVAPADVDNYCCRDDDHDDHNKDNGCCTAKEATKPVVGETCQDICCAAGEQAWRESNVGGFKEDTSLNSEKMAATETKAPACCEGKPSPCCDASCLDRLAGRECEQQRQGTSCNNNSNNGTAESSSSSRCRDTKGKSQQQQQQQPCEEHRRSTREKYAAKLEALGCLCRALVALGQESCCLPPPPPRRSSPERKRCANKDAPPNTSSCDKPVDSCCASGVSRSGVATSVRVRGSRGTTGCGGGRTGKKEDVCGKGFRTSARDDVGCAYVDSCCVEKDKDETVARKKVTSDSSPIDKKAAERDLENGLSGKEHVILSISGMTCTGCETKLKRTLASLTSVTNLKTSLVLSRAEFDLDPGGAGPVAEVMRHLERTTEFKCEKVSDQGTANIDIIPPCDAAEFVRRDWPVGVTDVSVVHKKKTKNLVNIAFDAKVVGARDLVGKGWDAPLALAPPQPDPTLSAGAKHVRHVGWVTVLSAVLTIPVLVLAWAPLPEGEVAYGSASLALATLVQGVVAGPFYPKAVKALVFSRVIEMDLLVVLSTSAAYVFSVVSFGYLVAGHPLPDGEFFETSTLLVTLIMVGRYIAALARQKAVESISVRSLQAVTAILVEDGAGEKEIDTRLLQYGDVFKVLPDTRIPTDGTVISGSSEVDESMVTGESRLVEKHAKSPVIAGSVNGTGTLTIRLDRLPRENTISAIANMVDEAKLSKPVLQEVADRVASYFVPVVVALSIITFCAWVGVGVAVQAKSGSEAVVQAITYAITVLIVSCPCAIGLAVPMVVVIASGVAAERGVVIKDAAIIEVARKTSHVVLDKTGTLTEGRLSVIRQVYLGDEWSPGESQSLLLALVANSKHPVSTAVAAQLRAKGLSPSPSVSEVRVLTGKGVEATTESGLSLRAGNSRWLNVSDHPQVQSVLSEGHTTFCFSIDNTLAAVLGLQDALRPDALPTVTQLQERGVAVHVLSGDDDGAVRAVTSRLGIPDERVRSRCTPADKQAYVQALLLLSTPALGCGRLRKQHFPHHHQQQQATVLFCGDGTNDAVALAQATIGVHVKKSSSSRTNDDGSDDVASSAADVVLLRPNLAGLLVLVDVSGRAVGRIRFNFAWSFVYNTLAVLLGGGAFAALGGARIPPAFAGLGEVVSVLPVVVAAVLLRWDKGLEV